MFGFLLTRFGLGALKTQIIWGLSVGAFVIALYVVTSSIADWKQSIIDNANNATTIASIKEKNKHLKIGNKVDETVISADDDELCELLGGCVPDGTIQDSNVQ